ncbi:arginine--tRNA ligase [Streptococcus azizii]|uniref:Arginine--tRNA ligase n=1 Tax=Streptococcus azizii TaxID=1579424 RepID=A0AB36JS66_9STRE|nr:MULTISPECIES: arginine--tRNA ligase [Streptococcus]MBF0776904.1 arginine--tRNA ligase [Streptococcus sp. 19428wD3_AN2]ONK28837.1 arginine--tRNA ligase [Streptococcus azizii]ONK30348.1 arginine--tRNA ligase [Streptococcus azizii]ONK31172.1 arginine--tRNA ligase [Streptococcus azizii]TFU82189.1 arginine--tRNA ligase [Streptococcus sp. AN2]
MNQKMLVAEKLATAISSLDLEAIYTLLEKPKSSEMGDIAFPAFSLAKVERKAPQAIAADIVETLDSEGFEKIVATGPYVNFFLDKAAISHATLTQVIKENDHYGQQHRGNGQNVTIDMSSPNIAKPFSVGHLRSTVIGDALANIYEKMGYKALRINHLGDWGKQFGLLIVAYKLWGDKAAVEANPIAELLKLYVRINAEADENPELDEEGRKWFKKLEDGDAEALELWQWFRDESLVEFNRIYDKLNITFDYIQGEAFYNDKMDKGIEMLKEKNLLQESNGAMIVNLENDNLPPALIMKSDGATLYITRDIATALYRKENYNFAKSIYVVGQEQANHFKQLKAVLKKMGYDWSDDLLHIAFGLVTKDKKKLSTRKGNIILLEPTLDEAVSRALSQIEAKNPDLENKEAVAEAVGVGAVKFFDLKTDRENGYDFDLEAMVSFEGETGPYVQYAYARIQSILRKANFTPKVDNQYQLTDAESWEIIKHLQNFATVIEKAADKYDPSLIAKYAIQLAQSFNKYYAHTRILDENPERDSRLALAYTTGVVLKEALRLLGVEAPEKM